MAEAGKGPIPPLPSGQDWYTLLTVYTLKRQSNTLLDDFIDNKTQLKLPYYLFKVIKITFKSAYI